MKTKHLLFAVPVLAMGMVSCSNEDDVKPQNIITGESVKTSLAINVPTNQSFTRQSADVTQNNKNFRSMSGMVLYPMSAQPTISTAENKLPGKGQLLGNPTDFSISNSHHVYRNVQLPIGAKHFLLYGEAPDVAGGDFVNGSLTRTVTDLGAENTSAISFALNNIAGTVDISTPQNTFLKYLNALSLLENWKGYTGTDKNLNNAYTSFTQNYADKNRAGSAFMIKQHVQDLYDKMVLIKAVSEDATVDGIADEVMAKINTTPFKVTADVVEWADRQPATITNFPQEQNLPDGAALLTFTSGAFQYLTTGGPTEDASLIDIANITYPADLQYYSNTPVKTKKETIADWTTIVGDESTEWDAYQWTGWGDVIDVTTRTVALQNNMHYGVACLKTTVKCNADFLEDNAMDVANAITNQSIPVGSGFPVTGILVGGQPSSVDWNFIDNDATARSFKKTVYDKDIVAGMVASTTTSAPNYTLLLDNVVTGGTQDVVNICIELENNSGQSFYGVNGYIPNGAKFYLIGKLNPTVGTFSSDFPTADRRIYPATGIRRVFMQDYMTTANITIKSLQNAYVTIPDMRSIKLELGVSVDLKWLSGFKFEVGID